MSDARSTFASKLSAHNDAASSSPKTQEKTTLWCNVALVSEIDGELQVVAYPSRLPLDGIHEWKANFGTSKQRTTTERFWARLRDAATKLEPGQTTVFGSKDGELKPGVNFLISRVSDASSSDESDAVLDSIFG